MLDKDLITSQHLDSTFGSGPFKGANAVLWISIWKQWDLLKTILDKDLITSQHLDSTFKAGPNKRESAALYLTNCKQWELLKTMLHKKLIDYQQVVTLAAKWHPWEFFCSIIARNEPDGIIADTVASINEGMQMSSAITRPPTINWQSRLPKPLLNFGLQLSISRRKDTAYPPLMKKICSNWSVQNYTQNFIATFTLLFGYNYVESNSDPQKHIPDSCKFHILQYLYENDMTNFIKENKTILDKYRRRDGVNSLRQYIKNAIDAIADSKGILRSGLIRLDKDRLTKGFMEVVQAIATQQLQEQAKQQSQKSESESHKRNTTVSQSPFLFKQADKMRAEKYITDMLDKNDPLDYDGFRETLEGV